MSLKKQNIEGFPWDSFFDISKHSEVSKIADSYTMPVLNAAALAVFEKKSCFKQKAIDYITHGCVKLIHDHPNDIEAIKKETRKRFFDQLKYEIPKEECVPIIAKLEGYKHLKNIGFTKFIMKEFVSHMSKTHPLSKEMYKKIFDEIIKELKDNTEGMSIKDRKEWVQKRVSELEQSSPISTPISTEEIGEQEDLVRQLELLKKEDDPILVKEKEHLLQLKQSTPPEPRFVEYTNTTVTPIVSLEVENNNTTEEEEEDLLDIRSDGDDESSTSEEEEEDILDLNAECFTKKDYEDVQSLEEDLTCEQNQVCDISTKDCIDKNDEMEIQKIGETEYTNTSNTNVELITKLKEKFKHIQIHTPQKQEWATRLQPQIDLEIQKIDMDETPAHVSTRIPLEQYTSVLSNLQSRSRLSVDQRFNDRTKARRDLIRKCLNL